MPRHQAPTDGGDHRGFHSHIEFHPPLRRPNLLKYLAGPEIGGGNFLSGTSPEEKAAELRAQPEGHYKQFRCDLAFILSVSKLKLNSNSYLEPRQPLEVGCSRSPL